MPKPVLVIGSRAGQPFTCGACISVGETNPPMKYLCNNVTVGGREDYEDNFKVRGE